MVDIVYLLQIDLTSCIGFQHVNIWAGTRSLLFDNCNDFNLDSIEMSFLFQFIYLSSLYSMLQRLSRTGCLVKFFIYTKREDVQTKKKKQKKKIMLYEGERRRKENKAKRHKFYFRFSISTKNSNKFKFFNSTHKIFSLFSRCEKKLKINYEKISSLSL